MNIQYIAPSNRQTINPGDTAILVRGEDAYGLYRADTPATVDLDPDGLARQAEADADLATTYTTSLNASPHHSTAKDHRAP